MDSLDKFLEYNPPVEFSSQQKVSSKNELKVLSKQLLKATKGDNGQVLLTALSNSISRLIPNNGETITVTTLSKLTFVWQTFHSTHTDAVVQSLLAVTAQVLHECCQVYLPDSSTKLQLVLGLLISICHPSEKLSPDQFHQKLKEAQQHLQLFLFNPPVENTEVCALSGTAWCSVTHVLEGNLMSEYDILYSSQQELRLGHIALTAGMLNLAKVVRGDALYVNSVQLKVHIISLCKSGVNDFHSFSCLLKFLQSSLFISVLQNDPHLVTQELVDLLWAHCDSPVEGVGEFSISCYKELLSAAHKHLTGTVPLHQNLLDKLLPMPWNVKAKLKLLTVLLPWVDTAQLLRGNVTMVTEISQCLAAQYLAAAAGKLYMALIQGIDYDTWEQVVMHQFIQALSSPVRLIRYNTRQYWLPSTLTCYRNSKQLLLQELSANQGYLPALVAVYRACRKLSSLGELPVERLRTALLSSNDEMRADVITLVCSSAPSDGVSAAEIKLLEDSLPYNLNIDCPTFRQQLISAMNSWMGRLSHTLSRTGWAAQKLCADDMVSLHVQYLWRLCVTSLVRGSNYQRKETVLKLSTHLLSMLSLLSQNNPAVLSILHSCICGEAECDKKRACLTMTKFQQQIVNNCLLDSSSEIQSLGYKLLSLPITPQFQRYWGRCTPYLLDKLQLWKEYISSAKASEAEAGALIYTLIVQQSADVNFVQEYIIDVLVRCVCAVKREPYLMASSPHVYGYLVAIQRILENTGYLTYLSDEQLTELGVRLVDISHTAVSVILGVLMSTCPNKDVSPSFEQMEEAVDQLVDTAMSNNPIVAELADPSDRVSAWCWLTLKEVCCLCGTMSSHRKLLQTETVDRMRDIFYNTLTKCRHRGVIEGSSAGLTQFTKAMLQSTEASYRDIPSLVINQVLDTTIREDKVVSSCSVTRRSGGFPIIVQSVLVAENNCKQSTLLHMVMTELLRSCDQLATVQQDERRDMPQVHSLNILKALVVDAKLAGGVRGYLARITMLCIDCFSSPVWALRNAATQLYASCSQRMIGQKRQADGSVISTSCVELFSQYPPLYKFMLDKLEMSDSNSLSAEIFPILSLISMLSPCTLASGDVRMMQPYREVLMGYMANPIHVVRRLTSLSIVATVESVPEMCSMVDTLSQAIFTEPKANTVHTQLLTLQEMVKQLLVENSRHPCTHITLESVTGRVSSQAVHFISNHRCHVLRSSYLQLLTLLSESQRLSADLELQDWLVAALTSPPTQMPGEAVLLLTCSKLLCSMSNFELTFSLLDSVNDIEISQLLIDHLTSTYTSQEHSRRLQQWLGSFILVTRSRYYRESLLATLLKSFKTSGVQLREDTLSDLLAAADKTSSYHLLLCVYARPPAAQGDCGTLQALYKECRANSEGHVTFTILCECVEAVVSRYQRHTFSEQDVLQLLSTLLALLQDEGTETRLKSAQYTAQLLLVASCRDNLELSSVTDDLHYNIAIYKVLRDLPRALGVGKQRWVGWLHNIVLDNYNYALDIYRTAKKGRMFFQEEDNVYYERTMISRVVCSVLKEARPSGISIEPLELSLKLDNIQLYGIAQSANEIKSAYNTLCLDLAPRQVL